MEGSQGAIGNHSFTCGHRQVRLRARAGSARCNVRLGPPASPFRVFQAGPGARLSACADVFGHGSNAFGAKDLQRAAALTIKLESATLRTAE